MESPVANSVTSQPRAASPSEMLPATVSHAPYCRGGVRQATGARTAIRWSGIALHGSQHLAQRDGCEAGSVIGKAVGNDQFTIVDQRAASINDIRYVAFSLILVRTEQGFAEAADDFGGILAIEQERANAVFSHGADAMAEDQPPGLGFDRRSTVSQLNQLP